MRKILFIDSRLYKYPYRSENLSNELNGVFQSSYYNGGTYLKGKYLNDNEFLLWEKWGLFRGFHSIDGLAYFSGKYYVENNQVYVVGTIYMNVLSLVFIYLSILVAGGLLVLSLVESEFRNQEFFLFWLFGTILFLGSNMYFKKRVRNIVQSELNLSPTGYIEN